MKSYFSNFVLWFFLFIGTCLIASTAFAQGDFPIEKLMREVQARYYYFNRNSPYYDEYIAWPRCLKGTPASHFPKDGFYRESMENPEEAAKLVREVAEVLRLRLSLTGFVVEPFEGLSEFNNLQSIDGKYITDITPENYRQKANAMLEYVKKAQYVAIAMNPVQDHRKEGPASVGGLNNCSGAQDAAAAEFAASNIAPYGPYFRYFIFGSTDPGSPGYVPPYTIAGVSAYYGRFSVDFGWYPGDGKIYLKLNSYDVSGPTPKSPVRANGLYHLLPGGGPSKGSIEGTLPTWYTSMIPSDESVDWAGACGSYGYGWTTEGGGATCIKRVRWITDGEGEDCACACTSSACPAGTATAGTHSADFRVGLGHISNGWSAGYIMLHEKFPSPRLDTLACLQSILQSTGAGVNVFGSGGYRQVTTPYTLAELVETGSKTWEIKFYRADQIGPSSGGAHDQSGKIPYQRISAQSRWTDATHYDRLVLQEIGELGSSYTEFVWNNATQTWALSRIGGSGTSVQSEVFTEMQATDTSRLAIKTIKQGAGPALTKHQETFTTFSHGESLTEVREVGIDPSGNETGLDHVLSYEYFTTDDSSTGAKAGLLSAERSNQGPWRSLQYDTSGRMVTETRPFLSNAFGSPENQCRVSQYQYVSQDLGGTTDQETLTIQTDKILGQVVGRKFTIWWPELKSGGGYTYKELWEVVSTDASVTDPTVAIAATTALITKTRYYYSPTSFVGRIRSVQRSDNTITVYDYSANLLTTYVYVGHADATGSVVTAGTSTVTVNNPMGGLVSQTVRDVASNLIVSQKTATAWDNFGRPTAFRYHDGLTSSQTFDCCGLSSETDQQGVATSYMHDALKRLIEQTRAGITTRYTLDGLGRNIKTERIAGGATLAVDQTTSDSFGPTQRKDALNRQTSISQTVDGSGQKIDTVTLPDGGTRIETFARDGSLVSVSGTAVVPINYEYGVDSAGVFTKEIRVGSAGEQTEWIKSYTDFAGRPFKTVYADGSTAESFYNTKGQLTKTVDQDGVGTLFAYNALGEQEVVAVDLNLNGVIDTNGSDRITKTVTEVAAARGTTVRRAVTSVWGTNGDGSSTVVSTNEASVDGRRSWSTSYGLTTSSEITYPAPGVRQEITTTPDGVQSIRQFTNDRLITNTVLHPSIGTLASATYVYDAFGRLQSTTDARSAKTTYTYYDDDQIKTVASPDPDTTRSGPGYDAQTTSYTYDAAGRLSQTTLPDATITTQEYYPTGQVKKSSGSRTYPQLYSYDSQGRLKTLTTWQNHSGDTGQAVTTWNYDPARGWLTSKRYADNTGPSYGFFASGRLKIRTWARGLVTTYAYNAAADLTSISYSDTTPSVALTYDRRGRLLTTTDASGVLTRSYHASGALQNETYGPTGLIANASIHRTFDPLDRLSTLVIGHSSLVIPSTTYGYDAASRLKTVTSGSNVAAYSYLPNTSLLQTTTFTQGGATRLSTTKAHDLLNRLTSVTNTPSAATASVASYGYNAANQRSKLTREDGAYWDYRYDTLGQLTFGQKKLSSGTLLGGYDYGYTYDDIGNRKTTTTNGQSAVYTPTLLNQYTDRTVPGSIDVTGAAAADATVTVNLQPTQRQGERFYRSMAVNNTTAPQNTTLTIVGVKNNAGPAGEDVVSQITQQTFVAQTPETFTYDADGNLTTDARWIYTWDAENRLTSMTTQPSASTAGLPKQKLEFTYDAMGRRIQKKLFLWNLSLGTWNLAHDTRFIYDGWNLQAEYLVLGTSNLALQQTYIWGQDLSGSLQGAGGVGGLLLTTKAGSTYAVSYDGNGNIQTLTNQADGTTSADFEYDPFGNTIKAVGPAANVCPFGFSTKYTDSENSLIYYGFRYYSPSTGRWLSRDPIEESGGVNLYAFVGNDGINAFDPYGLEDAQADFVSKSFINGIPVLGSLKSWKYPTADINLALFAKAVGGSDAFNQNPDTDAKDGKYRLYTRVTIKASCCKDAAPTVTIVSTDMDGGAEGPLSGTINLSQPEVTTEASTVKVHWKGWGASIKRVKP